MGGRTCRNVHGELCSSELTGELPGLCGAMGKITVPVCAQMEIQTRSRYSCDASVSAWSQVAERDVCSLSSCAGTQYDRKGRTGGIP